ncbi:hypothetical protein TRIP_D300145 [uncultured Paludibacter sp.]|nr:hypothetical protein TRIP_D300145 [uncultured Paludibacter sp.]
MQEIIIAIIGSSFVSSVISAFITRKQTKVQVKDQMDQIFEDRIKFLQNYTDNLEKKFVEKITEIQKASCIVQPCKKRIPAE